jgi:hypothetical protein
MVNDSGDVGVVACDVLPKENASEPPSLGTQTMLAHTELAPDSVTFTLPDSLPETVVLIYTLTIVLPVSAPSVVPYPPRNVVVRTSVQPDGVEIVPVLATAGLKPNVMMTKSSAPIPAGYEGEIVVTPDPV